jgi:hypothetical protein
MCEPISTPVRKGIQMDHRELTLAELLADPIALALMAADRVDPAALKAMLSGLTRRLQVTRLAEPIRDCVGRDDRQW